MAKIKQDATELGITLQDCGDERAIAAPNIGQDSNRVEVVGVEHRASFMTVEGDHAGIEDRGQIGVLPHMIEKRFAKNLIERRFTGQRSVMQSVVAGEEPMNHSRSRAKGTFGIRPERTGKRRMGKLSGLLFLEDAVTGQETENAIERALMCVGRAGNRGDRPGGIGLDLVGNTQFGHGTNGAAQRGADKDLSEFFCFCLCHIVQGPK